MTMNRSIKCIYRKTNDMICIWKEQKTNKKNQKSWQKKKCAQLMCTVKDQNSDAVIGIICRNIMNWKCRSINCTLLSQQWKMSCRGNENLVMSKCCLLAFFSFRLALDFLSIVLFCLFRHCEERQGTPLSW